MPPPTAIGILSSAPLLHNIVDVALPPDALHRLGRVSREIRPVALAVQTHMFKHHRFLKTVFRNPSAAQALLTTGAVLLTGKPIFTYFTTFDVSCDGLTFVVEPRVANHVIAFLETEGLASEYDTADDPTFDAYGTDASENPVLRMHSFLRKDKKTSIYIMIARISPLHVLLMQNSTFWLNGICAGGFFSCYPWASFFLRTGFLSRRVIDGNFRAQQAELRQLGYTAVDQVTYGKSHNSLLSGARYIGDSWSWLPSFRDDPSGYAAIVGQGWSVCERVRLLDAESQPVQVVNSYICAVTLHSPLLPRIYLAATLTRFYLARFFDLLEAELRTTQLVYVPCRWDEQILPFLQHFYRRQPFSVYAQDNALILTVTFDYSRRVGY